MITGITKVRNESLILEDTLNHVLTFCESVILYDDDSTDNTVEIAKSFDRVRVINGTPWALNRRREETRQRKLLLAEVKTPWTWCFDADERLVGELPDLSADGYKFRLFDGYITPSHGKAYKKGPLLDLKRKWGPEYRDILMLFKTHLGSYSSLDRREPVFKQRTKLAKSYIKHYGKCISIEQWEETCAYYADHWPEPYRSKWHNRRGKAIHTRSDFGRPLYTWWDLMTSPDKWIAM